MTEINRPRRLHQSKVNQNEITSSDNRNTKERSHNNNRRRNNHSKNSFPTFKVGQVFGFIYNLILLYFVFSLIEKGKESLAIKLFAINAGVIIFGVLITFLERVSFNKKNRSNKNRRERPVRRR